jgi:hypothetical protein
MHIDRSRFLLLTATMAGGACSSSSAPSSAGGPVVAAPVISIPAGTASAETKPEPPPNAAPARDAEGGVRPGAVTGTDEAAETDEDLEGGASCDNDVGSPPSCASLRAPGPQCESFDDTKSTCAKLGRGLRPRVAERAVDCILAKSGKQGICQFDVAMQCASSAVKKACIEPKTQAACAPLVKQCQGNLKMSDCQAALSAVTAKNRKRMITCMTEGCGIDYCWWEVE